MAISLGGNMKKKLLIICGIVGAILLGMGLSLLFLSKNTSTAKEKRADETIYDVLEKTNKLESFFMEQLPITNSNELKNQTKLLIAITLLEQETSSTFSKSRIEEVLFSYFGADTSIHHENILDPITNEIIYNYNSKTQKYSFQATGSYNLMPNYYFISSSEYEENKDTILLTRQYLFIDDTIQPYALYSNLTDYKNKMNAIGVYNNTEKIINASLLREYKNQLPGVIYTYKKEKHKYILKSITLSNKKISKRTTF